MVIVPKKESKCRECIWATYHDDESVLASGHSCRLNPFRTIAMGLGGTHADRKRHIEDGKEERKNRKKGSK